MKLANKKSAGFQLSVSSVSLFGSIQEFSFRCIADLNSKQIAAALPICSTVSIFNPFLYLWCEVVASKAYEALGILQELTSVIYYCPEILLSMCEWQPVNIRSCAAVRPAPAQWELSAATAHVFTCSLNFWSYFYKSLCCCILWWTAVHSYSSLSLTAFYSSLWWLENRELYCPNLTQHFIKRHCWWNSLPLWRMMSMSSPSSSYLLYCGIKWIIYPTVELLPLFSHPHVVQTCMAFSLS